MKKLMTSAAVVAMLGATPAFAAGPTQTYNFDATVAAVCTISGAGTTVHFGALTDGAGAYTGGTTSKTATDSNAYCNQAGTKATISHVALTNTNTATTGFTNIVNFTPSLATTEGGTLITGDDATGTTLGAFSGLSVSAQLQAPTSKLVAGTYNGSITVTLAPQS